MIRSVDNVITSAEFHKNMKRHIRSATTGQGPIGVRVGGEVVGVFLGADDFDALYASAVRDLLRSRRKGATISQQEAENRIRLRLKNVKTKS